jgi:hypothetical protein
VPASLPQKIFFSFIDFLENGAHYLRLFHQQMFAWYPALFTSSRYNLPKGTISVEWSKLGRSTGF